MEELLDVLKANGFPVQVGEQATFLLSVPTTHLRVGELDLFAYVFESHEASLNESTTIGEAGSTIGRRQLLWPQPPSFFAKGRLILFLVSDDPVIMEVLERFFGPRFAGGEIPNFDVMPIVHNAAERAARSALAQRLGVAPETLMLVESSPVRFQNASLGCPMEGNGDGQATLEGYLLTYESNGTLYPSSVSLEGRMGKDCLVEEDRP